MADSISEPTRESSHPATDGDSEVQAITISGSPEMGLNDQPTPEDVTEVESREASPIPVAIHVVHPSEPAVDQSGKLKGMRPGQKRPLLPDQMLLNSYLPPRGPAPPMEEVTAPGLDGVQEIIDRWRPFNRGESAADHMHDLYPVLLQLPVAVRAGGLGEEYSLTVPVGTVKEDLKLIIEDGMQVRNRNYVQSTKLVSQ